MIRSTRIGRFAYLLLALMVLPLSAVVAQEVDREKIVNALAEMGFENVGYTEDEEEIIFTIQNSAYRIQGVGVAKALDLIQKEGLPNQKSCCVILLDNNIPQISVRYNNAQSGDSLATVAPRDWETSYDLGDSWKKVRKNKVKNSSLYKVDILIYPQFSFANYVITQIYTALLDFCPSVEVSLWKGSKIAAQIKIPVYNDGYGALESKVHPGHITLSQRFRLPYNIFARATVGFFSNGRYGVDVDLKMPLRNEQFTVLGRMGLTGACYWDAFKLHYDPAMTFTWALGGSFYWKRYNTEFTAKAEQWLLKEFGGRFDMIRHFRYCSVGLYAMVTDKAPMNGGFRFQLLLPPYKYKRFKNQYIPRVNVSPNMGIAYNAGNERKYYKEYRAEASDNIMQANSFNPYFIKTELLKH